METLFTRSGVSATRSGVPARLRAAATVLVMLALAAVFVPAAQAITLREVIELSRAKAGDEVILAFIDLTPEPFVLDPADVVLLRAAGVSDRVLAALVRHRRELPTEPEAAPPAEAAGYPAGAKVPGVWAAQAPPMHHVRPAGGVYWTPAAPAGAIAIGTVPAGAVFIPYVVVLPGGGKPHASPGPGRTPSLPGGRLVNSGFERFKNDGFNRLINDGMSPPPPAPVVK